ncbi:hypothetical protein NMG60_11032942 [Bertholletia excelsa]
MGLDSLPTSNISESFSTPSFDTRSLQDAHLNRRNLEYNCELQIMHSGNLHDKVEVPVPKTMEPRPQKMINRPIEKFQSEVLPPKSAKSIPITHHKLLSPIKSPQFVSSKNATHIMETAARIIEPGPQATTANKAKMPHLGTSSVPIRVKDLKEKLESAQKPTRNTVSEASSSRMTVDSNAAKFLKGQSLNKSWNGSADTTSFGVSSDSEDSGTKNKGKSISLALQAKVNVQKREGLCPNGSRSLFGQKEQTEVTSSQPFKSQKNGQKGMLKKAGTHNASGVLRQNNQKQNCPTEKDKSSLKSQLPNSQGRKGLSADSSFGREKNQSKYGGNSKTSSRKLSPEATDGKKEASCSSTKNVPRKKRSIDGSFHVDKNQAVDSMLVSKTEKQIPSNSVIDKHFTRGEDGKRKGMDIVSFTFTAPMARSLPGSEISRQVSEKNDVFGSDCRGKKMFLSSDVTNSSKLPSPRCNVIGADALSVLLEQKLRELNLGVGSSNYCARTAGNSPIFPGTASAFKLVSTSPMSHDDGMHTEYSNRQCQSNFYSSNSLELVAKHQHQGTLEMVECENVDTGPRKLFQRHPSPISVLEPSLMTESCNSSDSADTNSIEGSKQCSSVQALEVLGLSSSMKSHLVETDADLSDSASSASAGPVNQRIDTALPMSHSVASTRWEFEYINEILFNVELMFKDFALGRAREIINPHLFNQLENRKEFLDSKRNEPKLRRKVLFDSVSECIDVRCRHYASGGCRMWTKGLSTLRRKEWLAEEVYKEISSWEGMWDCMVDDLVDKDMSSQCGKWLDFEVEAFELGVEIEGRILDSLINEVVADILVL